MSECDAFGLTPVEAAAEVLRVVGVVNNWKLHFVEMGVSPRDIESLAQQIDGEFLLRQRNGFEPERFVVATGKRLRKSPFRGSDF
jgi:serine/threonine-protein kinase HipA